MFELVPTWFKRLAAEWDRFGFPSFSKSLRQAEREIEKDNNMRIVPAEKLADLNRIFKYHAPKDGQPEKYEQIREAGRVMAITLTALCEDSPELDRAIEDIRSAVFFANASIACKKDSPG